MGRPKYADEKGCLQRFVPNLEGRNNQRDEAFFSKFVA
jgi:hypothetical protein